MNAGDLTFEAVLRRALSRHPAPVPDVELSTSILRRLSEGESSRRRPTARAARVVLGAYWLVAALGTASLLARISVPQWASAGAWALAVALVPVGYGAALWPAQARASISAVMRLLAPPLASRR